MMWEVCAGVFNPGGAEVQCCVYIVGCLFCAVTSLGVSLIVLLYLRRCVPWLVANDGVHTHQDLITANCSLTYRYSSTLDENVKYRVIAPLPVQRGGNDDKRAVQNVSENSAVFLTFICAVPLCEGQRAERIIYAVTSPSRPRSTTCSHISITTVSLLSSDSALLSRLSHSMPSSGV